MYTYGFDICAKLCHFSSVDVHVVGMSMLEYSTAVRQWELVYLTALSSGILIIRKKESTGEGKVHTLELTCIVHKHTQTENRRQLHGWFSPTLLLQADSKMQIQDCVQFWVGGLEETCLELPFSLISLLPSSRQHSPHERSHASQQRATSDDTQHANMGSVCQESCLMSSLNFIEAPRWEMAVSGTITHSTGHFPSCADDMFFIVRYLP